jgi:hypothetical protein
MHAALQHVCTYLLGIINSEGVGDEKESANESAVSLLSSHMLTHGIDRRAVCRRRLCFVASPRESVRVWGKAHV